MFYIAIVGRPNVGKSTLFNKIVGGRPAIVDNTPGVTRDRNIAIIRRDNHKIGIIDSGGFEPYEKGETISRIREQTMMAIEEADIIFFMVDGTQGITGADDEIAKKLRKAEKPILLVVNKIDNPSREDAASEFARLGLGETFLVSAEHSMGIVGLMENVVARFPEDPETVEEEPGDDRAINIAFVGKPNAGKSSIVNRLLGESRMTVSAVPGTTRDAIDSEAIYNGRKFVLIDTAGIRKKAKVTHKLEKYSVIMAVKAIERADVALLMIDAVEGATGQEAKIAAMIEEARCGCVIVVNKWDIPEKDSKTIIRYEEVVRNQLRFLSHAPMVFVSAKTGQRVNKVLDMALVVFGQYTGRITTGRINDIVSRITSRRQSPIYKNRRVKFYYATQARICPPTFVLMTNWPEGIHFSYERYIVNQIKKETGFDKTPIRIIFRKHSGKSSKSKA
ncbi:GTP-binding protein EngA [hydrothermal vent metagenome]|uniref:GTPase Der n=1 Tax=hydrothermal vent metagenome TaxID=652676 RepID=A0A3B1CET8_9ZZZZ